MSVTRRLLVLSALALPWLRGHAKPAPDLVLPSLWSDALDPTGYLVSEKYDGVRAHWDGAQLRFRSGRAVPAPAWFTQRLPRRPLDGELWLGRSRFDALSAIVRRETPVDAAWRALRYVVFELPEADGPFADRARQLREIATEADWPQLVAAEQTRVADRAALQRRLTETVAGGGEGLVLHLASAPYRTGRSDVVLKLKPYLDAEATVVGHHPGKGKYAGQLGALELRDAGGRHFLVGSGLPDALRRRPPPIGSVVTYRYRDLTSTGLPRFASFLRVYAG
ncbi:MAG: DNA ligase [Proteobacteria bacterium]|nr:DNA ligase [Pseudomonadota bacterium]